MSNALAPWSHINIVHNSNIVARVELTEAERLNAQMSVELAREIMGMVSHIDDKKNVSLHLMLPEGVCMFIAPFWLVEKTLS